MAGRQQGFDPALLTCLVFGGKLVRSQSGVTPHEREGKLLLRLTQLDRAALQNNHSYQVPLCRPVLVEKEVPLEHKPAFLIRSLYLTLLGRVLQFSDTSFSHNSVSETKFNGNSKVLFLKIRITNATTEREVFNCPLFHHIRWF